VPLALLALLTLPAAAFAQDEEPLASEVLGAVDITWVLVATFLVFFMQAGFALLEIGFSRGKNAGMGVAKILVNFALASIAWWAIGFAIAFGGDGSIAGDNGFLVGFGDDVSGLAGDLYGETFSGGPPRSSPSSSCSARSRWRSSGARRSSA
jgi:Amt family ammonium transporter